MRSCSGQFFRQSTLKESVLIAHRDIMFVRNDFGGWMIELNVFYLMTAVCVFFLGAGKYSLSRGQGRWD